MDVRHGRNIDVIEHSEELVAALSDSERAWERFLAAVDAVDPTRAGEPGACGDWSIVQLLGHVAFWDEFEIGRIGGSADAGDVDWQKLNDEHAREFANLSLDQARTMLIDRHDRLWTAVDPAKVRSLMYDHYVEHGAEIERWNVVSR